MLSWNLDAYCTECGFDILSGDDEDLDTLTVSLEAKADHLYTEHIKQGKCNP